MTLDPHEIHRQILADRGVDVRIILPGDVTGKEPKALFVPVTQRVVMGNSVGVVADYRFHFLPEDAVEIVEGALLRMEEIDYAVCEPPARVPGRMVECRVVER